MIHIRTSTGKALKKIDEQEILDTKLSSTEGLHSEQPRRKVIVFSNFVIETSLGGK
jgi:hypothetical protein